MPVPDTVSAPWREILPQMHGAFAPGAPAADDVEGWRERRAQRATVLRASVDAALARFEPALRERTIAGVPVLEIVPRGARADDARVVVHLHGGGYTNGAARTSLPISARLADATGVRVLSIEYGLAPEQRWRATIDQVVAVLAALPGAGHPLERVAVYGESAGGGLAAGALLAMRDRGLGLPAALLLLSPWADVTDRGDTSITLRDAEPVFRYDAHLRSAALAYADPDDQRHPHVSPVYGDFSKGFPPTLIQGGTRELFLSHFVRLYRAIDAAGGTAVLDLHEGMPHGFVSMAPSSDESAAAFDRAQRFLAAHLTR
jgi:acetyl esterase/lipase